MVLCVAGQSNAVGYDESEIPEDYMKRLFYARTDRLTLFEAYPDDPKEGWMPKRECRGGQEMV